MYADVKVLPCRERNWFALLVFAYQDNFPLVVFPQVAGALGQPTTIMVITPCTSSSYT